MLENVELWETGFDMEKDGNFVENSRTEFDTISPVASIIVGDRLTKVKSADQFPVFVRIPIFRIKIQLMEKAWDHFPSLFLLSLPTISKAKAASKK